MRYLVNNDYRATTQIKGSTVNIVLLDGQTVNLDPDVANWVNGDCPGTLSKFGGESPVVEPVTEDLPQTGPEVETPSDTLTEDDEVTVEIDATPSAVTFAEKNGIDLLTVKGTGTNGRIIKKDVEALVTK